MIYLVPGAHRNRHRDLVDSMYQIRAKVFNDRLGWDVQVKNGREIDRFDDCNPLYLISVDDTTGRARGSLRLLPTTGPNMLRDVFSQLLSEGDMVENPLIWESSRFSMDPNAEAHKVGKLSIVTLELLHGIVEVGLMAGLQCLVSVFDARMIRIFRAANFPADIIGTPTRFGKVLTYAGFFEVSERARDNIAAVGNIKGSVIGDIDQLGRYAA